MQLRQQPRRKPVVGDVVVDRAGNELIVETIGIILGYGTCTRTGRKGLSFDPRQVMIKPEAPKQTKQELSLDEEFLN